jgi:PAS domain S-box-containing protein
METEGDPGSDVDRLRRELDACREALNRARYAETILQQLAVSVKDFAILTMSDDGRVVHWNEGAQRLLGYGAAEMHGQYAHVIFTPEDRARDAPGEELRKAAAEGRAEDENWLQRKDGSRFWASGIVNPILGPGGAVTGYVKVLQDLTSRKLLEDDLKRLNQSLEERVRERTADLEDALKEMGAFSYSIAHDLRAPLQAMSGFAELLNDEFAPSLGELGREYARRISAAAERMSRMITDLLAYSRLTREELPCHPTDVERVVDDVVARLSPEIVRRQARVVVERPLPRVLAHEITLGQVFTNLISNALKFVAPGVRPEIRIRGEDLPDAGVLWVEDNGIGIAPEYHDRIFRIFERLHAGGSYPGTGIGLAIVNRAVERMKGRVGVESDPGKGSRFWIRLRRIAA